MELTGGEATTVEGAAASAASCVGTRFSVASTATLSSVPQHPMEAAAFTRMIRQALGGVSVLMKLVS